MSDVYQWKLWYDEGPPRGQKVEDYQRETIPLNCFDSFEEYEVFWQQRRQTDKSIASLEFPDFSNIRLFKPDIEPTWEDRSNDGGGKLVIRVREPPPEPASRLWQVLLQAAFAGNLHDLDHVCGMVFSLRPKGHMLSIWTRTTNVSQIEEMTKFYKQLLGLSRSTVQYQWHKESEQRNSLAGRDSTRRSFDGGRPSGGRRSRPSGGKRLSTEVGSQDTRNSSIDQTGNTPEEDLVNDDPGWVVVGDTKGKKVISATTCDELPAPRTIWSHDSSGEATEKRGSHGRSFAEDRWRPMPAKAAPTEPSVNLAPTNPWGASTAAAPAATGSGTGTGPTTATVKLEATNPWSSANAHDNRAADLSQPSQEDVWQGPDKSPRSVRSDATKSASGIAIPLPKPKSATVAIETPTPKGIETPTPKGRPSRDANTLPPPIPTAATQKASPTPSPPPTKFTPPAPKSSPAPPKTEPAQAAAHQVKSEESVAAEKAAELARLQAKQAAESRAAAQEAAKEAAKEAAAAELALAEARAAAAEAAAAEAATHEDQARTEQDERERNEEEKPEANLKHRANTAATTKSKDVAKKKKKKSGEKTSKKGDKSLLDQDQMMKSLLALLVLLFWTYCGYSWVSSVWGTSEGSSEAGA